MLVHSPVEFDFRAKERGLAIEYYGKERIKFIDEVSSPSKLISSEKVCKAIDKAIVGAVVQLNLIRPSDNKKEATVNEEAVKEVFQEFSKLFEEPNN